MPLSAVDELLKCTRCPELVDCRTQVVPGEFMSLSGLLPLMMVVLRNPGRDEDKQGRPSIGKSGRINRGVLADFTDQFNIYISNMVKCFSPDNRPPTATELDNCRQFITEEVNTLRPAICVLAGKEAQAFMFSDKSEDRHKVRAKDGIIFVSTYHPAARGIDTATFMRRDIWRAITVYNEGNK